MQKLKQLTCTHMCAHTHTHTLTLSYVNRTVLLKTEFQKTTLISMPVARKEPSFSYRFAEKPGVKWGSWRSGLVPLEGGLGSDSSSAGGAAH